MKKVLPIFLEKVPKVDLRRINWVSVDGSSICVKRHEAIEGIEDFIRSKVVVNAVLYLSIRIAVGIRGVVLHVVAVMESLHFN